MVYLRRNNAAMLIGLFLFLCFVCFGCRADPELMKGLAAGVLLGLFFGRYLSFGIFGLRVIIMLWFLHIVVLGRYGIYIG